MTKKSGVFVTVISIAAIVLSVVALIAALRPATVPAEQNEDVQSVMYLGTNDKDTNQPVFTPDEAKAEAEKILINHFGGYTIQEANGGWIDGERRLA